MDFDQRKFVGIEIGGTKLQFITVDSSGNIVQHIRRLINPLAGAEGIQAQIIECVEKWEDFDMIDAVGVGFGGPVNFQTGCIQTSDHVWGWDQFNLKHWLESLTGKQVAIDNDANVGALGEAIHGNGKTYDKVFYMTIGSGIGGGMIIDGKIYHGKIPGELEVGHIRLNKKGITLQSQCSGWAVNKKVRHYINKHASSFLAQLAATNNASDASLLKPAIENEDEAAYKILEEITDNIAFALSHVTHLLHPEIIIIGGGLSLLGESLRSPIALALPNYLMKAFLPPPPIQISALGENVVPIGAFELAKTALRDKEKN